MIKHFGILIWLSVLFLSGCAQMQTVESILLVQSIGYDLNKQNTLHGTFVAPSYVQNAPATPQFFDASGKSQKDIYLKINSQTPQTLGLGQLRVVLLGKELARHGVYHIVDTLQRSPEIGSQVLLVVADGNAESLLKHFHTSLVSMEMPGIYLTKLIKQNIDTENVPKTNLHLFSYHLFDPGCDPVLPLVGMNNGAFFVKGLALFNNDEYVGKVRLNDMFVFKRLYEKTTSGSYGVGIPSKDGDIDRVMIRQITSDPSYQVKKVNGIPSVQIVVNIRGGIEEYSGDVLLDKKIKVKKIEKVFQNQFQKQADTLIRRFQRMSIDPLCIGGKVRSSDRSWNLQEWKKQYPKIKIQVKAKVNILRTGTKE